MHLRTRDGEPVIGKLEAVVRESGAPTALQLRVAPVRSGGYGITATVTPPQARTIAIADIGTLRKRKPGVGNTWLFIVIGAAIDAWILSTIVSFDWS